MKKPAAAVTTTLKGLITVEGIRTIYEKDGTTVKDQRAVLKMNKGMFSKRFLVPLTMFDLDDITKAMVDSKDFFPVDTKISFNDVKKVEGQWMMYEGTISSVIRPVSPDTLDKLLASRTIVKKPT
jgi:hypothetical protein